jgi:hypothetical protein
VSLDEGLKGIFVLSANERGEQLRIARPLVRPQNGATQVLNDRVILTSGHDTPPCWFGRPLPVYFPDYGAFYTHLSSAMRVLCASRLGGCCETSTLLLHEF